MEVHRAFLIFFNVNTKLQAKVHEGFYIQYLHWKCIGTFNDKLNQECSIQYTFFFNEMWLNQFISHCVDLMVFYWCGCQNSPKFAFNWLHFIKHNASHLCTGFSLL